MPKDVSEHLAIPLRYVTVVFTTIIIGDMLQQRNLAAMPDSLFSRGVMRAFPCDDRLFGWTIKDMGPLYVPRKGDTVRMDIRNYKLYRTIVEYETRGKVQLKMIRFISTGLRCHIILLLLRR